MRATGVLPLHHAFALSGRVSYMLYTQGDALGYVLVGLSDRPPVRRGRILYGCLFLLVTHPQPLPFLCHHSRPVVAYP